MERKGEEWRGRERKGEEWRGRERKGETETEKDRKREKDLPSIRAKRTPPTTAALAMALGPARAAKTPPVAAPLIMEFHGSSFCRIEVRVQSQQAKSPPQTANCPPSTGPLACTADRLPAKRAPAGAIRAPLMVCQRPPPMAPMEKAPPTSSTMRQGHGSRSAIPD
jgi:hypothetical protein